MSSVARRFAKRPAQPIPLSGVGRVPIYHRPRGSPTRCGDVVGYAVVDMDDLSKVAEHRWFIGAGGYVVRNPRVAVDGAGARAHLYLHREVLDLKPGDPQRVRFRSPDLRDCRRSNLAVEERP